MMDQYPSFFDSAPGGAYALADIAAAAGMASSPVLARLADLLLGHQGARRSDGMDVAECRPLTRAEARRVLGSQATLVGMLVQALVHRVDEAAATAGDATLSRNAETVLSFIHDLTRPSFRSKEIHD